MFDFLSDNEGGEVEEGLVVDVGVLLAARLEGEELHHRPEPGLLRSREYLSIRAIPRKQINR